MFMVEKSLSDRLSAHTSTRASPPTRARALAQCAVPDSASARYVAADLTWDFFARLPIPRTFFSLSLCAWRTRELDSEILISNTLAKMDLLLIQR